MPRQSSRLAVWIGSRMPAPTSVLFMQPVLGEERAHALRRDDERNEQRPAVEPAQRRDQPRRLAERQVRRRSRSRPARSAPSRRATMTTVKQDIAWRRARTPSRNGRASSSPFGRERGDEREAERIEEQRRDERRAPARRGGGRGARGGTSPFGQRAAFLSLRREARRAEPRRTRTPTRRTAVRVLRGSPGSSPGSHLSMSMRRSAFGTSVRDLALVAFEDVVEVGRERERLALLAQIVRRDVGEELLPGRLVELAFEVLARRCPDTS